MITFYERYWEGGGGNSLSDIQTPLTRLPSDFKHDTNYIMVLFISAQFFRNIFVLKPKVPYIV